LVAPYGGAVGQLIKKDLIRHGVDVSQMIENPTAGSRLVVAISFKDTMTRNFLGLPEMLSPLQVQEINSDYMDGAKYIYVHRSHPGQIEAAKLAHAMGIKVVMDCDEGTPNIKELLQYVDYAIASEKCYGYLFPDGGSCRDNLDQLREMCAEEALAMVTLGEKGLAALDGDGYFELPAFHVDAVDTTGCGDTFHGAYLAGLIRGMDNRACSRYASGAAAICATRIGSRVPLPTHEVLTRFLETGKIDYTEIDKRQEYYSQIPIL
jgi:sugar/nucleoside kinase (ribokinase family)